jgi:hypothetical protein
MFPTLDAIQRTDLAYVVLHLIFLLTSFRLLPFGIWFGSGASIPQVWLAPTILRLAPIDHLRFNIQWTLVLWSFFLYPAVILDNLPVGFHVKKGRHAKGGWPRWLRRIVKHDRTIVGVALVNSLMGVMTISRCLFS